MRVSFYTSSKRQKTSGDFLSKDQVLGSVSSCFLEVAEKKVSINSLIYCSAFIIIFSKCVLDITMWLYTYIHIYILLSFTSKYKGSRIAPPKFCKKKERLVEVLKICCSQSFLKIPGILDFINNAGLLKILQRILFWTFLLF